MNTADLPDHDEVGETLRLGAGSAGGPQRFRPWVRPAGPLMLTEENQEGWRGFHWSSS